MTRWNGAAPTAAPFWNLCSFFHGSRRLPAFLSSGLSKKKTLKKTDNPFFLSELKQTRRKRSVCRKEGGFAPFLPPAFMRGEGRAAAGGVPRSGGESLLSHGCAVPAPPEGKPRELRTVLAPRIYEGGGPRSGRGRLPRGGESLLSHGCAVPAPPEGKPRALRTVPAPRIYEGGGPRSGGGSPPRGGESLLSHGFAVPAPPERKPRVLRTGAEFRFPRYPSQKISPLIIT